MARKKKDASEKEAPKTKKTSAKKTSPSLTKTKQANAATRYTSAISQNFKTNKKLYLRYLIVVLVIIAIGAFFYFKKNWFVAAVVNNQPITTIEYYNNLKAKDSKQVLNQIVRDKLITQEANKKGIVISEDEINKKTAEIRDQVGGEEQLKQALESRNISEQEFKAQIKTQLEVEKLLEDQTKVSDQEVEDYIAKNKDNNLTGVDLEDKEAVRKQLVSEKLNEKFQAWYEELQKNAKIYIFI